MRQNLLTMRKNIVAGNWKMNNDYEQALILASEVINMAGDEIKDDTTLILIPPYPYLKSVGGLLPESGKIFLGAQNCHEKDSGAYTGEVSSSMLSSLGVEYVVIGHSERREYFNETPEQLAEKVNSVLSNGMTPIFCCGEPLEIREHDDPYGYVKQQITDSLFHLTPEDLKKIVIAYEPIWAIGTGKTATADQAQYMHAAIRAHISEKYGSELASQLSILYGGSCKPSNAEELFSCEDVDGGLIGGASLKSRDFVDIAKSF